MRRLDVAVFAATLSAFGLFILYLTVLTLVSGLSYTRTQLAADLPFLAVLLPGFGAQICLLVLIRAAVGPHRAAGAAATGSGSLSGVGMIACCAHYVPTLLPFVGASAASTLIMAWRTPLLILALVSNAAGLAYMVYVLRKTNAMARRHEQASEPGGA